MRTRRFTAAIAVMGIALAGCSKEVSSESFGSSATAPEKATALHRGVEYYPACGNEVLLDEHGTYYPFQPYADAGFPSDPLADAAAAGLTPLVADAADATGDALDSIAVAAAQVAFPAGVPSPGTGDNVGTLVLYDAGKVAYWVSESGNLSTWLTGRPLTYGWVC